mgnify:CR=1 FL=1
MKLTARSTSRMYALTCLACVIWLWQSLVEANNDGSLFNWATIVFSLCLLVVIGWSGWNASPGGTPRRLRPPRQVPRMMRAALIGSVYTAVVAGDI